MEATTFVKEQPEFSTFKVGYFGASTGAASAMRAAAFLSKTISAIVSRGGRPDLAMDLINKVKAPTLLIVGEQDTEVLKLNQGVFELLNCKKNEYAVKKRVDISILKLACIYCHTVKEFYFKEI